MLISVTVLICRRVTDPLSIIDVVVDHRVHDSCSVIVNSEGRKRTIGLLMTSPVRRSIYQYLQSVFPAHPVHQKTSEKLSTNIIATNWSLHRVRIDHNYCMPITNYSSRRIAYYTTSSSTVVVLCN